MNKVDEPKYNYDINHDDKDKLTKIKNHQLEYVKYLEYYITTNKFKYMIKLHYSKIFFTIMLILSLITVPIVSLLKHVDFTLSDNICLTMLISAIVICVINMYLLLNGYFNTEYDKIKMYGYRAADISRELSRQHAASTLSDGDYLSNIGNRSRFKRCTH